MIELFKLNHSLHFPSLEFALTEPNGLLAFGGDLSPERLVEAYKQGIFPWFSDNEPILWWSPDPRAIIVANTFVANRSLRRSIKKYGYHCKLNHAFSTVIRHCASVPRADLENGQANGTWITEDMLCAYERLHQLGHAHSVEVFNQQNELVGGLYGVVVSGVFCGESMFHLQTDASKVAFLALAQHMVTNGMSIIDCQLVNPHLLSLGCKTVSRQQFVKLLQEHRQKIDCWQAKSLSLSL